MEAASGKVSPDSCSCCSKSCSGGRPAVRRLCAGLATRLDAFEERASRVKLYRIAVVPINTLFHALLLGAACAAGGQPAWGAYPRLRLRPALCPRAADPGGMAADRAAWRLVAANAHAPPPPLAPRASGPCCALRRGSWPRGRLLPLRVAFRPGSPIEICLAVLTRRALAVSPVTRSTSAARPAASPRRGARSGSASTAQLIPSGARVSRASPPRGATYWACAAAAPRCRSPQAHPSRPPALPSARRAACAALPGHARPGSGLSRCACAHAPLPSQV